MDNFSEVFFKFKKISCEPSYPDLKGRVGFGVGVAKEPGNGLAESLRDAIQSLDLGEPNPFFPPVNGSRVNVKDLCKRLSAKIEALSGLMDSFWKVFLYTHTSSIGDGPRIGYSEEGSGLHE